MKLLALLLLGSGLVGGVLSVSGQGTFQNLGFEAASLVPISSDTVEFAPAFPSWTGTVGGEEKTSALYNFIYLDTSRITIIDHGWSNPYGTPEGLIDGNFTAIL